uniref:Uncharacterized protein n=1 Tax=candidate division WOR-3 bacterium TaxID=2052148 RepID=A0A7C2K0L7_UNCW3
MPDILQIFSDYFLKKIDESEVGEFKVKIPKDLIEHVLRFYLQPYLSDMKINFFEKSLEIEGTNVLPVQLKLQIGELRWDREQKIVEFELDVSDLVYKLIRSPLHHLGERTKEVITFYNRKLFVDFEKLFSLKPQWNSITYALRNKIKLTNLLFTNDYLELVFERVTP